MESLKSIPISSGTNREGRIPSTATHPLSCPTADPATAPIYGSAAEPFEGRQVCLEASDSNGHTVPPGVCEEPAQPVHRDGNAYLGGAR